MKRKLKPLRQRKPKVTTTVRDMSRYIKNDTGFTEDDILVVIKSMIKFIKSRMLKGFGVSLPKLGIFYPLIKPARTVMSMNGGIGVPTKMKMSDRWQAKFNTSETLDREMAKRQPTEQEVKNLYEN